MSNSEMNLQITFLKLLPHLSWANELNISIWESLFVTSIKRTLEQWSCFKSYFSNPLSSQLNHWSPGKGWCFRNNLTIAQLQIYGFKFFLNVRGIISDGSTFLLIITWNNALFHEPIVTYIWRHLVSLGNYEAYFSYLFGAIYLMLTSSSIRC